MSNNFIRSPQRRSNNSYVKQTKKLPKNWDVRISKNIDNGRPYYVNFVNR